MSLGKTGAAMGGALSILVVEDECLVRLCTADYLRECGHQVVEAASAEQALEVLSSGEFAIDVVFSDIQLAGTMTGLELARRVRADHRQTKVILTSGAARSVEIAGDLCDGGPLVPKPYDPAQVLDRIQRVAARRAAQTEPGARAA